MTINFTNGQMKHQGISKNTLERNFELKFRDCANFCLVSQSQFCAKVWKRFMFKLIYCDA